MIAGWALAQRPVLLKGLTVQQAAAPARHARARRHRRARAARLILFPSLALLFRLVLPGASTTATDADGAPALAAADGGRLARLLAVSRSGLLARVAGACLLAGFGLLTVAEAGWAHAIGVVALLGFLCVGFLAIVPAQLAELERE